jgi:hypothetical protein
MHRPTVRVRAVDCGLGTRGKADAKERERERKEKEGFSTTTRSPFVYFDFCGLF